MARVVLGSETPEPGQREVPGLTLGEVLERLAEQIPWLDDVETRVFVDGVDARRLEGEHTPVGDEDTVLVTRA